MFRAFIFNVVSFGTKTQKPQIIISLFLALPF